MTPLSTTQLWERFQTFYTEFPSIGLAVDLSRMSFPSDFFQKMAEPMQSAFEAMDALEKGGIANPDEKRMVGHYWLRNSALAPTADIRKEIDETLVAVRSFAADVHAGRVHGARGEFRNVLVIGIGGSALGPQFVAHALGHPLTDKLRPLFFDNTDPDGMDKALASVITELGQTLCVVISKSGGTKETRNGMLEAQAAYQRAGLSFAAHAVAVTGAGSELEQFAQKNKWTRIFPMWDWVGGRTSELSAVGLLPAALQGFDIDAMLAGARACDELTRSQDVRGNPAAQLALMWHSAGGGAGAKDMVVLPYKDRLELFSKYLQQLIMESLGKELDLSGKVVNQGLAVYGNKGSTDQHAYVQQLREGLHNFFVTFIEVLGDRREKSMEVDPGITSGDYLSGFFQGTRQALYEKGRESITLTIKEVSPAAIGMLIALFERAVGLYASLVHINAYHQPGVEAGKKAATAIIGLQLKVAAFLGAHRGKAFGVAQISDGIDTENREAVFKICEHLSANPGRALRKTAGNSPFTAQYASE
ncbi:MAG: glucose-6-phosphate isomerase [Verrucomicrobia bacterium]|nr:glucose-6-phosphate isomerase [Verrucomicrobiota bacterium]MBI3869436.1 glucose-6-phosphate isomerase [Verrucomicrobiota bacterium]